VRGTFFSAPFNLNVFAYEGLEFLGMTNFSTSLGQIMLCRVAESGYVQIAGPVNTKDHKKMCREMLAYGAEIILIDGAIDRKSIAAPDTSDAIILSTGAVLSRSIKKVVEETAHIVGLYQLPVLEDGQARDMILSRQDMEKIMLIKGNEIDMLDLKTGLLAGKFLDEAIDEETDYIYIPGAMTSSVISDIHPAKLKEVEFILKDPTKIFVDAMHWQQLRKKGFTVKVLENIKVAALTVNPHAPEGYSFEHEALLKAMKSAVAGIPVVDVKMGGEFSETI